MKTKLKLELLSKTIITSGVTFKSINLLNKQYKSFFDKMTLGFEVEVSGGELNVKEPKDLEELRREFDADFIFTEEDFINSLSVKDLVSGCNVKPKYGFANDKFLEPLKKVIEESNEIGFDVIMTIDEEGTKRANDLTFLSFYIKEIEKELIAGTITVEPWMVKNLVLEQLNLFKNFFNNYPIVYNNSSLPPTMYIEDYYEDGILKFGVALLNLNTVTINTVTALKKFSNNLAGLRNILNRLIDSTIHYGKYYTWAVLDNYNRLNVVNIGKFNMNNGINSELIEYDKEELKEAYEIEIENERERQWAAYQDSIDEDNEENDSVIVEKIHREVQDIVDKDAKLSRGYHQEDEWKGLYTVVESDSSINPPGAEIVSKVFKGPQESLEWLDKIFDMIENTGMQTCASTGLHTNIGTFRSLSNFDEGDGLDYSKPVIDVVKLALLSGDHYLLQQFDRINNSYAKPLASNLEMLKNNGFDLKQAYKTNLFDNLKILNKQFIRGQGDRYRTINMQHLLEKGYLEFRIAGGSNYHTNEQKVHKAVYRYMQLCAIACDPQAYFKEYMTELYKLFVDKHNINDTVGIKHPRPKNAVEALHYIKSWNSRYSTYGNGPIDTISLAVIQGAVENRRVIDETNVIDTISIVNTTYYSKVDSNLLYSFRILMLFSVKEKSNSKQYLIDIWNNEQIKIKEILAPKLHKNKPQWLKYLFTGTGLVNNQRIVSNFMNTRDKLKIIAKSRVHSARLIWFANRSTPAVVKNGEKVKTKKGYGKIVKTRKATAEEEKQLKKGVWIRTRSDNKKPGDKGAKRSTYRKALGKKQKVRAAAPDDATTYTLKVNDGDKSILKLLQALSKLGAEGSSRSVTIQDDPTSYSIDGDGADKIYDIQVQEPEVIEADENTDESTDNYSYELNLKVREFNTYGTIENMLENLKAQTDIGLLTTVTITNSNGFLSKFQIGGQNKDEVSEFGIDTIISIDKTDNAEMSYHNPEPEDD